MCMGGLEPPIHLTKGLEVLLALLGLFLWCLQVMNLHPVVAEFGRLQHLTAQIRLLQSSILLWWANCTTIPKKEQCTRTVPSFG